MINAFVGRYGEIFLKRSRRPFFLQTLRRNIKAALVDIEDLEVTTPHSRILVTRRREPDGTLPPLGPDADRIEEALGRVFGLVSFSRAVIVEQDLDALTETARTLFAERTEREGLPVTFRITTTRADKRFPMRSDDINRHVAAAIFGQFPNLKVDLSHAELEVGVEIRPEMTFVYVGSSAGPGGLPVGSNGKAMLLLSGGIDSPVAGWRTMKRGVAVEAVYFHSFPYTSEQVKEKVLELARALSRWQPHMTLFVVPFAAFQEACRDNAPARSLVLLYRRQMVRIAERIASERHCTALITGESIGQVASQTLPNLACIDAVATIPILRPLVCNDKSETIELARRIGTYRISVKPFDDCCSLFVARHPELAGSLKHIVGFEKRLPIDELAASAVAATERIVIRTPRNSA